VTVVHIVVAGEVGGAERMLVGLASAQSAGGVDRVNRNERKHVVALVTPSDRLRALFRDAGLVVDDRGPAREGPLTYLARSLGRADVAWVSEMLRRRDARIVHLHTFASQVLGTRAALRLGLPVVRTEHSTRVYDDPSCWPFSRWSLQRVGAAVCISEHVRRVAEDKAPWAAPILRVVPNGVDVDHFAPRPHRTERNGARTRFVALGRLEPRKGLDIALEALAAIPDAELDVVGEGESRDSLERQAARLGLEGRVRFLGFSSDVRDAIAAADAALSSARTEGLGIAVLEAMAMGRPVVALPTGGITEIVKDGETGWLAHGSGAAALARAMEDACRTPAERDRRGARARTFVAQRYSLAAMRAGYEAVYASLEAHGEKVS